jgi:hypothetical protein
MSDFIAQPTIGGGFIATHPAHPSPTQEYHGPNYSPPYTMSGFDGIIQLHIDVIQQYLRRGAPSVLAWRTPYHLSESAPEIDEAVAERFRTAAEGPHFRAVGIRITLREPTVVTLKATIPDAPDGASQGPVAQINWQAQFMMEVERVGPPPIIGVHPFPQIDLNLGAGTVKTFATISVDYSVSNVRMILAGQLHFTETPLATESGSDLFDAMLGEPDYKGAVERALGNLPQKNLHVTPGFVFPLPFGAFQEESVDFQISVTRRQNDSSEVLALCMNVPARGQRGDATSVQPLLSTQNYACSLTVPIIRSIVVEGWNDLSLPKSFATEVPLEVPDPDDPAAVAFRGKARVRMEVQSNTPGVSLSVSARPLQDALKLVIQQEAQLLALWDENGRVVDDLGDLRTPQQTPLSWRIQLFDRGNEENSFAGPFLKEIASELLKRLYAPFVDMQLSHIDGYTLSTKGVVVVRGQLS